MKTLWKLLVTFGVIALFVFIFAFAIAFIFSGVDMPAFRGGNVAVIPIKGQITLGGCQSGLFGTVSCADVDTIKKHLRDADKDPTVKAIVLDIYSGGGSVVASRELVREVKRTEKPVVAWIGEVGASGAYYVASAADKIVADEDSTTGSIGVIMFIEHYYGLMDWAGVNVTVIKSEGGKDIGSPYRPMTDDEKAELQEIIDKVYENFIRDVAENRGLDIEYVRSIANGRIMLGADAYNLKLVDELGGQDDAIALAAKLGNISGEPGIIKPQRKASLMDLLV
jgi:protease IV